MATQKHLILEDRVEIEKGLDNRKSFKKIATELGKDCSTISKEVRGHRVFERKGSLGRVFNDCAFRKDCDMKHLCSACSKKDALCSRCNLCRTVCSHYQKMVCPRLSKPPYVCNGCKDRSHCTLEKARYRASRAQAEYETVLRESRSGINTTEEEVKRLDQIISPLISNGQSIHHICSSLPDSIMHSEKTIYTYISAGLFHARDIDMPRKVRFRPRKKEGQVFKVDKKCRIGRTIEEFRLYRAEHPELPVTEIDSVEGKKGGAVLLTLHCVSAKLQLAFLRQANDSASVTYIFNQLFRTLGAWDYQKIFPLILADNGSEFSDPSAIEFTQNGERISRLFYCDPSAPGQKGHCENNHEFIRRIIPKGVDFGQYTQAQINLMMNHINSYGRPELNDRSPYEMFAFLFGEELLQKLGVMKIPRDSIMLTPKLLSSRSSKED